MNGMCDIRVHDDSLVERPVFSPRPVGAFHRHIQRHSTLDGKVTFCDLAGEVSGAPVAQLSQETHVSSIDAEERHPQRASTRRSDQESAIATDREHHVDIATRCVVHDVDAAILECLGEAHGTCHRIGTVTVTNHQNSSHREPPAGPASTARRM